MKGEVNDLYSELVKMNKDAFKMILGTPRIKVYRMYSASYEVKRITKIWVYMYRRPHNTNERG